MKLSVFAVAIGLTSAFGLRSYNQKKLVRRSLQMTQEFSVMINGMPGPMAVEVCILMSIIIFCIFVLVI